MPLIIDSFNPRAVEVGAALRRLGIERDLPEHLFVVLGGDGFMLKTVNLTEHPAPEFLGLNCGRVGFLLSDLPERLADVPGLLAERIPPVAFPRIQMTATNARGERHQARAMNDIYLERMTGQTANLKVTVDGAPIVERLVADGIICSTALGSTAYAFSAGAAACHPTLSVMGVTPICPHAPALRPLVVPLSSVVEIEVQSQDRRPVRAVADGREWEEVATVTIRDAAAPVRMSFLPGHDFLQALVRKLLV